MKGVSVSKIIENMKLKIFNPEVDLKKKNIQ